ncbi:hypothetical protein [Arcanobacterium canis]
MLIADVGANRNVAPLGTGVIPIRVGSYSLKQPKGKRDGQQPAARPGRILG